MKRFFVCVLALVLFSAPWGVRAQDALRIAAVVNDDMISVYDLNMRLNLVVALSALPDTNVTRQRLGPQVLRSLIDDELKRQEANRLGIPVSEGEIESALRRLEKGNGLDKGGLDKFLASRNIQKSSLTTQIESEIAWGKLVQGRFSALSQVSDEEIDEVLNEIESSRDTSDGQTGPGADRIVPGNFMRKTSFKYTNDHKSVDTAPGERR